MAGTANSTSAFVAKLLAPLPAHEEQADDPVFMTTLTWDRFRSERVATRKDRGDDHEMVPA